MKNSDDNSWWWVIILLMIALLYQGLTLFNLKHRINSLEEQVEVLRERQDIYEIYL